jgi:hypothetical protein
MWLVSVYYALTEYLCQAVGDNKGTVEELIIGTAKRLLAVDKAVNQGDPNSAKPWMTTFVG